MLAFGLRGSPGAVAGRLRQDEANAPLATPAVAVKFSVDAGMSAGEIGDALSEAGVLTDSSRFRVLLGLAGGGSNLKAGCYVFTSDTPASEVLRRLRAGATAASLIPIPEGLRIEQIGEIAVRAKLATREEWDAAIASARPQSPAHQPPPGASLLGYLLPASYPIECRASAEQLVGAMLEAFEKQVTPDLIAEAERQGLSLHEVLTLASIVEREAQLKSEQPLVASVFRNRLEEGMQLQADPTVQFAVATPESVAKDGWWKRELTLDDLAVRSPYNTYRVAGLPPGPIANPGIDAIKAVIRPAKTDYLYFVAKGDGSHVFAPTLDEHNANVKRYLSQ